MAARTHNSASRQDFLSEVGHYLVDRSITDIVCGYVDRQNFRVRTTDSQWCEFSKLCGRQGSPNAETFIDGERLSGNRLCGSLRNGEYVPNRRYC
jgi:hypothetical protein